MEAAKLLLAIGPGNARAHSLLRDALDKAYPSFDAGQMPVESLNAIRTLERAFGAELSADDKAKYAAAASQLEKRLGFVKLVGLPDGALVELDNRVIPDVALRNDLRVDSGNHALKVTIAGYKPYAENFTVAGMERKSLDIRLEKSALKSRLRIESNIEPSRVTIDGKSVGRAPVELDVEPGKHEYVVISETYKDEKGEVESAANERAIVHANLVPLRAPVGIRVDVIVDTAYMLRDDTPFNTGVADGQPYASGTRSHAGLSARAMYSFNRARSLMAGLQVQFFDRPLDRLGAGFAFDWCPDALSFGGARWCPTNVTAIYYFPGDETGAFHNPHQLTPALRLGSRIEYLEGRTNLFLGLAAEADFYERDTHSLSVTTALLNFGFGIDL